MIRTPKQNTEPPVKRTFKPLQEYELVRLDKELQSFRVTKSISFPVAKEVSFVDRDKWLRARGGIGRFGGVILPEYEELENQYSQWLAWKFKNQKIESAKVTGLEELASTLAHNQYKA